ncbi:MAG TPA: 5'/3'-nucleotidase SurE [Vicinamibacterales bacterium]|jgi:5'-nucleotidase
MPRILVTNDDGVHSEGIRALADALMPLGHVTIVAPIQEASAIGHALTLRRPLRIDEIGLNVFAVDGTPTDCVNLAITHVLKVKPDLIVSGINKGWNLGDDVTYSGTVSGALEGALLEIPSIAVSTQRLRDGCEFGPSAEAAAIVAQAVLEHGLPKFTLLNINTPRGANKGFRVTVQAKRNHVTTVDERVDPRQRPYYWIEEGENEWEPHDRSDYQAVRDGYISITPLQPDMTAHDALSFVEGLTELSAGPKEQDPAYTVRKR